MRKQIKNLKNELSEIFYHSIASTFLLKDFQVEKRCFRRCHFISRKREKFGKEKCPHFVTHTAKKLLDRRT
jgi:hypothetical protein